MLGAGRRASEAAGCAHPGTYWSAETAGPALAPFHMQRYPCKEKQCCHSPYQLLLPLHILASKLQASSSAEMPLWFNERSTCMEEACLRKDSHCPGGASYDPLSQCSSLPALVLLPITYRESLHISEQVLLGLFPWITCWWHHTAACHVRMHCP